MKFRKKPEIIEALTFEEFVAYGREHSENFRDGVPWSFTYEGWPVTHETDQKYLINGHPFSADQVLVKMPDGKLVAFWKDEWFASHECCDFNAETSVAQTKSVRLAIKGLVEALNGAVRKSRSRSLAITKLEESSMWLGKDLQELNEPNPYPNSHDPGNPKIDPTAAEACALPRA